MAVALLLMGCDSDPLAIFDETPPEPQTAEQADARQRAEGAVAAAKAAPTPDLRDVPDRPAAAMPASTRDKVVEGLIADRQNARYTDEAIRLQGSGRQSAAPAVPEPPKSEAPTAVAAKTAAASAASRTATPSMTRPVADAAIAAPQAETRAATPPPAPKPPTPVPAAPAPPPAVPTATPSAVAPAPPVVAPSPTPAPAPAPRADAAIVVDRSALDALGSHSAPALARSPADGDQVATIQFAYSSSRLSVLDWEILRQVAAIQRQSGGSLVVVGHASSRTRQLDKVAHEMANLKISMARANAVAEALVESGVPRNQIVVEAVANARPVYAEAMPTGEAGNRRAEIFLVR